MHVNWALMLLQKAFVRTKLSDTTNYDDTLKKKEQSLHDKEEKKY